MRLFRADVIADNGVFKRTQSLAVCDETLHVLCF